MNTIQPWMVLNAFDLFLDLARICSNRRGKLGTRILRLMFLSYSRLLEQPDLSLVKLKKAPARQRVGLLKLLKSDPVQRFLVCVSEKELRFRVADPGVRAGAAA